MTLPQFLLIGVSGAMLVEALTDGLTLGEVVVFTILYTWVAMVYFGLQLQNYMESLERRVATGEEIEFLPGVRARLTGVAPHGQSWRLERSSREVGTFQGQPIPAWVVTPDGRRGDYLGVTRERVPPSCSCLELPDRHELILPPGLVYRLHPLIVPPSHGATPAHHLQA